MPQWKPEDEALYAELCRRAEQQSRETARRAAPFSPPSANTIGAAAPPPGRTPHPVSLSSPVRPALDQETLLILVVLAFLIRCRADRELLWALLYILLF